MKKVISILFVLLSVSVAMAETVTITTTIIDEANGIVEIGYEVTGGTNRVRFFALNVIPSDGNIVDVDNYFIGECNAIDNKGYGIFLGNIAIDANGDVIGYGGPAAPAGDPGALSGPNGVTLEMGSLYADSNFAPDLTGVLCTVRCDTLPTTLCIEVEDAARGGIVMEDIAIDPTVVVGCVDVNGLEGCDCWGDVSSGAAPPGQPDGAVSLSDVFYIYDMIKACWIAGYVYPCPGPFDPPSDEPYEYHGCADVSSGASPAGQRDLKVSLSDVFHIYNHIKMYPHTGYVGPCMFEDANEDIQPVPPE